MVAMMEKCNQLRGHQSAILDPVQVPEYIHPSCSLCKTFWNKAWMINMLINWNEDIKIDMEF